jgi:hypothetical protein
MLGIDHVRKVAVPQTVLSPLKSTGKATDAVVGGAVVKALVVTDRAYCLLVREPVWRMSGIRLP